MAAPTGSAAVDAEITAKLEEQTIQQEYKVWKKNTVSILFNINCHFFYVGACTLFYIPMFACYVICWYTLISCIIVYLTVTYPL